MNVRVKETEASFAALRQQVIGIEDDYRDLKNVVVGLDRKMDTGFQAINSKLDEKNKTQWGLIFSAMGFFLTFIIAVGTLAYLPIKNDLDYLKTEGLRRYERQRIEIREDSVRAWDYYMKLQSQLDKLEGRVK